MVRADGATRGDRAEAAALVVAGAVLLTLPFVVLLDRMGDIWFGVTLAVAAGGVFISGLGVRWFATEGLPLGSSSAEGHPGLEAAPKLDLPVSLRLVTARSRLRAHGLRFSALGSALVLLVVELGPVKWVVVGLFLLSFAADHVLLRPHRFRLDATGLHPGGMLAGAAELPWDTVVTAWWRHYPADARPPFPSGERVILELEGEATDVEFVFNRRYGGTEAATLIRALLPLLGDRVRVLSPRTEQRADVTPPDVSQVVSEDGG